MNDSGDLPPALKAFVFACVDSVEQVEILAALRSAAAPRSAQDVAAEIGSSAAVARHHLETLVARGLLQIEVEREVRYRFAPKTDALRGYATQLVELYGTSRMVVLRAVSQNAKGSLKSFLDAFKLRGPK